MVPKDKDCFFNVFLFNQYLEGPFYFGECVFFVFVQLCVLRS